MPTNQTTLARLHEVLSRAHTVAPAGFNRWLVPPAAMAIHLCIGMAYGFSVFWLPLSHALGITQSLACPPQAGFWDALFTTTCDWKISTLGWLYTLFFVCLGLSAAWWGSWVERVGPRLAGLVSALCWCAGLCIAALGVWLHQFWLVLLGAGVVGGIGLGLGYIAPVSTLIKWFPDRRGMATGMAIMGFGGGAMVGAPLAAALMQGFASPTQVGVAPTFLVLAAVYALFMVAGAWGFRVPAPLWQPPAWTARAGAAHPSARAARHVPASRVWAIPQFWCLWLVLCMNVSAGIGVIGVASPMLQEVFGPALLGAHQGLGAWDAHQTLAMASVAAGFTALLSLFNIIGRFVWSSLSDRLGRKTSYSIFCVLGGLLYASLPASAQAGHVLLFVSALCVIVSIYGGAFATAPAYLADLFGTQMVGAIHGRLLTAWAIAGVLGPVVVNYMHDQQLARGLPHALAYNPIMFVLVGMMALGWVANLLITPVDAKFFVPDDLALAPTPQPSTPSSPSNLAATAAPAPRKVAVPAGWWLVLSWAAVGLPMAWGFYRTLLSAAPFFK